MNNFEEDKVLVAYNSTEEDMCAGDSCFGPESRVAWVDGMTFEQARQLFFDDVQKDWYPDEDPRPIDQFCEEEFGPDVTGFWCIDKQLHDILTNVDCECGNDSAVYTAARIMKSQINRAASFRLTPQ